MSFVGKKDQIEKGDTVILFFSVNSVYPIEVVEKIPNKHGNLVEYKFQSIYGVLSVMDLVGKKYGSKIVLPRGWGFLLHPTCELWTKVVNHRTQIIYTPDISLIIFGLDLAPGSIVIEAGTGTGSLSHALIRTIYPLGHLYTFDFHEVRANLAREEFKKHGLSDWVTVGHRDVISDGFNMDQLVNAIFLDLPSPWEVVPHVRRTLKRGGKLCTFSPCIEQVQKTVEALKATGCFLNIRTQEVLQRPLSVQIKILQSLDLTPQYELESESSTAIENKDEPEVGVETEADTESVEAMEVEGENGGNKNSRKRERDSGTSNEDKDQSQNKEKYKGPMLKPVKKDQIKFRSIFPPTTTPGHTGYITFATMIAQPLRDV